MILFLYIPSWFWRPMAEGTGSTCSATNHTGCGYAFWSGIGSDLGEVTMLGILATLVASAIHVYLRFECHADRCHRPSWAKHPGHDHPLCKKHHPHGEDVPHTIGGRIRVTRA